MIIRDYKPEDWDTICKIFDLAKPDEMRGSCNTNAVLPLTEDKNLIQLFNNSRIIVAALDEEIVGFAGFSGQLISWLFVDPAYYRQGIGKKLLDTVLSYVGEKAYLNVAKYNEPAKTLYFSRGFHIVNEYHGLYNGFEAVALRLALNSKA